MKSQRASTAASLLLGVSLFATTLAGSAFSQSTSSSAAASGPASPWDRRVNADAVQADAWFQNYRFRNGTAMSPGHFTMTRPDLWAQHVGKFMQWLGDMPSQAKK